MTYLLKKKYFNRYFLLRKYFVLLMLYLISLAHLLYNGFFLNKFSIPLLINTGVHALDSGIIQLIGIWGGLGIIFSFCVFYLYKKQYCLELNDIGIFGTSIIEAKFPIRKLIKWNNIKNVTISKNGTYVIEGEDGVRIESIIVLESSQVENLRLEIQKRSKKNC